MEIFKINPDNARHIDLYMTIRNESLASSDSFVDLVALQGEDPFVDNIHYTAYFLKHTFVATENNIALGYVQAFQSWGIYRHGRHNFIIGPLYVSASTRGKGIGHKLIEKMDSYLQLTFKEYPKLRISLKVRSDNAIANHIYTKNGYRIIGTVNSVILGAYGYIDCIEMEKVIENSFYENISE